MLTFQLRKTKTPGIQRNRKVRPSKVCVCVCAGAGEIDRNYLWKTEEGRYIRQRLFNSLQDIQRTKGRYGGDQATIYEQKNISTKKRLKWNKKNGVANIITKVKSWLESLKGRFWQTENSESEGRKTELIECKGRKNRVCQWVLRL